MNEEALTAEVERLRAEIEVYRQRELEGLRAQIASLSAERDNYRQEAYRNADLGRQIAAQYQEQVNSLRSQLDTKEQVARFARANARAN